MKKPLILILTVLMTLFAASAFAAEPPLTIYAWGYGDLIQMVFQAIKYFVGSSGYAALFKIAALIGIVAFIINAIALKGQISLYSLGMRFGLAIFVWSLITLDSKFRASTDIQVRDVYTNRTYTIIEDVPLGFAGPIGFFSKVEYWLNHTMQNAFSITDSGIAASGAGYVPPSIGVGLIYSASQYRITDPNLYMTMNDYISDCVFPDVIAGYYDANDLQTSSTFWNSIADTHPARIAKVYDPDKYPGENGHMLSCPAVWAYLNTEFNTYIPDAANYLNQTMGLSAEATKGQMLGTALSKVMKISQSGTDFLLNSVALNSFDDAVQSAAAIGGVSGEALGFGLAKSQEATRANMVLTGIQTKKYLPMTKGILMCVLLCGMPLFCAFIVAMQMPGKLFGVVIGMYLAPCFWAVGDMILNSIIMVKADAYVTNWGGISGITAQVKPIVESQSLEMVNMVSSMYGIIPTMSLGFATLSAYALSSITGSAIGAATAGTSGASNEISSGSVSYGNVSHSNYNANKLDSYRGISAGDGFGYQQMFALRNQSSIVNSGEGVYGRNTVEKPTADGGMTTQTYSGGNLQKTEEIVGKNGREIGGIYFEPNSKITTYGEGPNTRREITGNTEFGHTNMVMQGNEVQRIESKQGENYVSEQIHSFKGSQFVYTDSKGDSKTIRGFTATRIGTGANSVTQISGVDEKNNQVNMTIKGIDDLHKMPYATTDGEKGEYGDRWQASGGRSIRTHSEAGETGSINFSSLKLNGITLTDGSFRLTESGAVVSGYANRTSTTMLVNDFSYTGSAGNYTAKGKVVDTEAKSTDTGTVNRDVLTLNGGQLNLEKAKISRSGNLSVIDGANADGMSYKAMVYGLKDNGNGNWSGVVTNSTYTGKLAERELQVGKETIKTGSDGTWTQTGDLWSYDGTVSFKNKEGQLVSGKGSVTTKDGKVMFASATYGNQLMTVDNNNIQINRGTDITQGTHGKGTYQAVIAGDSIMADKYLGALDNYRDAQNAFSAYVGNFRNVESKDFEEKRATLAMNVARTKNTAEVERFALASSITNEISVLGQATEAARSSDSHTDSKSKQYSESAGGKGGGDFKKSVGKSVGNLSKAATKLAKINPLTAVASSVAGNEYSVNASEQKNLTDSVDKQTAQNLLYRKVDNAIIRASNSYDGNNEKLGEVSADISKNVGDLRQWYNTEISRMRRNIDSEEIANPPGESVMNSAIKVAGSAMDGAKNVAGDIKKAVIKQEEKWATGESDPPPQPFTYAKDKLEDK
jgi:hypothetical protein